MSAWIFYTFASLKTPSLQQERIRFSGHYGQKKISCKYAFIYENILGGEGIFASCLSLIWISKRRTHIPFSHFDVLQSLRGRISMNILTWKFRLDDVSEYYIVCMLFRMCSISKLATVDGSNFDFWLNRSLNFQGKIGFLYVCVIWYEPKM